MAAVDTRNKTPRGNLKAPTRQDVISWVSTAWDLIQPEIVERSFLRCDALDGSEDEEFSTWLKEAQTFTEMRTLRMKLT